MGFNHVPSFDTKSAPRISRKSFDQEHPILHGHPDWHFLQPHQIMTSSVGISWERFKHGSWHFTHLSRTIGLTNCQIWSHKLLPVSCKMSLNTVQKCAKNGSGRTKSRIIRPLSNFAIATYSHLIILRQVCVLRQLWGLTPPPPPPIHFSLKLTNCVGVKPFGSMLLKRKHDIA